MKESEKMEALKKAYSDIILNTAQEAAARVMKSERKALMFRRDLQSTKQEAVRMILRLKHMMDAKTTEANCLSFNQKRKIDELEAQLNEAEELIIDLRAELYKVQELLVEAKDKHVHHLKPHEKEDMACCNSTMPQSKLNNFESTELDAKFCNSAEVSGTELENCTGDYPILPSMVVKSNEQDIDANGCVQRICAVEMNLVDERIGDDQCSPIKSKPVAETNGQEAGVHIVLPSKTKKIENLEQAAAFEVHAASASLWPNKFCGHKRRRTRYGRAKSSYCKVRGNQLMQSQQPLPVLSRCTRHLQTDTNYHCPDNDSNNIEKNNTAGHSLMLVERGKQNKLALTVGRRILREKKVEFLENGSSAWLSHKTHCNELIKPGQQCTFFSQCKSTTLESNVESRKRQLQLGGEGAIDKGASLVAASTGFTTDNNPCRESGDADNETDESKELVDVSLAKENDHNSQVKLDMLSVESVLRNVKTSEKSKESPGQDHDKMILKYTFSRKRKKDSSLNPNENSSADMLMKKGSAEVENIDPRLRDSGLTNDSSWKSTQLVQVARKLISLSGKS